PQRRSTGGQSRTRDPINSPPTGKIGESFKFFGYIFPRFGFFTQKMPELSPKPVVFQWIVASTIPKQ
ncbi:hypothetical protein, partial [Mesorhizobium sp. M7A.F.Ca.AU.002.02.1.1]|uniref:hypothetical protein n=1 Tax=Mesorhizobium sp. M7A.F.Ca.AU.002.02.1.1 TaxID=2496671 RepID=UPI0019CFF737